MRTRRDSPVTRWLLWYLCVAFTVMACVPGEAVAAPIPPGQGGALSDGGRLTDLARIQKTLELKLVRQRLAELGLTEAEIATRLARLDDEELHQLAGQLDHLGAGGSLSYQWACAGACAAIVLSVILIPLIVWLIVRTLAFLRARAT